MEDIHNQTLNQIRHLGFQHAGRWSLRGNEIEADVHTHLDKRNVLYAFVIHEQVCYLGKTVRPFRQRLAHYQRPGKSMRTSIRVRGLIIDALKRGESVNIYVFVPTETIEYRGMPLNLAAGLEDPLIGLVQPEWNIVGKRQQRSNLKIAPAQFSKSKSTLPGWEQMFLLTVGATYYNQGFFNVPVSHDQLLRKDEGEIHIQLGNAGLTIVGHVNRSTNNNGTARVMGRTPLRDWFEDHCSIGAQVEVHILGPTRIQIRTAERETR